MARRRHYRRRGRHHGLLSNYLKNGGSIQQLLKQKMPKLSELKPKLTMAMPKSKRLFWNKK